MGACLSGVATSIEDERGVVNKLREKLPPKPTRKLIKQHLKFKSRAFRKTERVFKKNYPTFDETSQIDRLRKKEYSTLDKEGHTYLDYTGGGLYSESQLRAHYNLLRHGVFGNPHSSNPTSSAITALDEEARAQVLSYFHASADEYTVIFTANASNAIKLLAESYPFGPSGELLMLWDNHNSIQGVREFARKKGAKTTYVPITQPEMRADEDSLEAALESRSGKCDAPRLFAYPAQSNFTGTQHPLDWIDTAQANGWDVLLDAASYVPTNDLDLSRWHPDFVPISFYKMFGYPSGVGCLIARKATLTRLSRPWFAGGTVWGSSVQADGHVLLENNEAFEDGTLNYLSLPAVNIGLKHLMSIGVYNIHDRVICLTDWLLKSMLTMRHSNGQPAFVVYGPQTAEQRGGTIAFNIIDPLGNIVDERVVEKRANSHMISLRTGCFCNPGAGEAAFNLKRNRLIEAFNVQLENEMFRGKEKSFDDFLEDIDMVSGGGVRISLGLMSNFADVYRFMEFACTFLDNIPYVKDLTPRPHC